VRKSFSILVASIMNILPGTAHPQSEGFPPVSHYGYLGYDFTANQSDVSNSHNHSFLFNWNFATYIVQPYIGQIFGGFIVRYNLADTSRSGTGKRLNLTGNLRLRLFPMSHFPFEIYWLEENEQDRREETSLVTHRRVVGLTQSYTTPNNTSTRLLLEHREFEFDDRVGVQDQFGKNSLATLDMNIPLGKWNLNWRNQYRRDQNSSTRQRNDRLYSILRHSWSPSRNWNMHGYTSYLDTTRKREESADQENSRFEFSNYLTWRPQTARPFTATGLFRHVEFLDNPGSVIDRSLGATTLSGSANYLVTDRISLIGNALGQFLRSTVENQFRTRLATEARYQALPRNWGTLTYQWNTGLGVRFTNQKDEWGRVFSGIGSFSHNLNKVFLPGSQPISLRFSQNLRAIEGTDGESTQLLSHILSGNWSINSARRSSVLNASISANNGYGGGGRAGNQEREFQVARVIFNQTENLSRDSMLMGSVSFQVRRTAGPFIDGEDVIPGGSADITYQHRMLFHVPLLQLRSSLRWYSTNFNTSLDDPTSSSGTKGLFWDNRLNYRIGRLDLRLLLRLSRVNEASDKLNGMNRIIE